MTPKCSLCSRLLDVESDPLSKDCGGDCVGCMIVIEGVDSGDYTSLEVRLMARILVLEAEVKRK